MWLGIRNSVIIKWGQKLPKSYQKKFAKSSCIDVCCLLSFVVKHQIWSHPKDWVCWSQRILKSNGVTKYCLYWWWMKLFMLVLSVGWKKEKRWKHSEVWLNTAATCFTKCIVLDGQVAISKLVTVSWFFLYVVTSRNVMTYSQVTMQHCDIWWASKYQDHLQVVDDDDDGDEYVDDTSIL